VKFGAGPKFDILMGAIFVMHLEAWLLAPSSATVISKLNVLISNAVSCGNVASVHHNSLSPSYSLSSYPTKHNPTAIPSKYTKYFHKVSDAETAHVILMNVTHGYRTYRYVVQPRSSPHLSASHVSQQPKPVSHTRQTSRLIST